jgi:hypothetical protein
MLAAWKSVRHVQRNRVRADDEPGKTGESIGNTQPILAKATVGRVRR